jgi:hypothetical protein
MRPVGESKAAWMSQPPVRRPHAPRPKQRLRYLLCLRPSVVTPARYGVSTRPERASDWRSLTSAALRRVDRWNRLSGRWASPSGWPEMPR